MTTEPNWQHIFVDEEVHHFLHKQAEKLSTSENEVLREMIFGEKAGMSAELKERLAQAEEAPYERRLTDDEVIGLPPALGGKGRHVDIEED